MGKQILNSHIFYISLSKRNMSNSICNEERPDYLKDMFENFFRYAKYNHFQFSFDHLVDAICGGLSGANFPEVNRTKLLQSLIDNCQLIQEAARRTLELRQPLTDREAEKPAPTKDIYQKIFLKLDEVCERFSLPKSQVKDRKWRKEHHFPGRQTAERGTVTYRADEIEKWIAENQTH